MESKDGGSGERRISSVRDEMEMSKEERDDFLRDHGAGVLSLAHGSESYAFPVSYGYDPSDELLCVMLGYAPESEKRGWLRETENATFVVHEMYDGLEAASVVLRGALVEVGEDEAAACYDAMSDNAAFNVLHESGALLEDTEYVVYRLDTDTSVGRRFEHDIEGF